MNMWHGIGRLTSDPDTRTTNSGMKIARYVLAVDRKGKDKGADFIRCAAFDRGAEFADKYLHKGTKIAVSGTIHTDSYTDHDGKKIYTTEVWISDHEFCESRSNTPESSVGGSNSFNGISNREDIGNGFIGVSNALDDGVPFA